MQRTIQKIIDGAVVYRTTIAGVAFCGFLVRRMGNNMRELEMNTAEKKLFDPTKAKA